MAYIIIGSIFIIVIFAWLLIWSNKVNRSYIPETESSKLFKTKVGHIIDGDTFDVTDSEINERIRLYAIDCPEDGQGWGNTATAGLVKLIGGRDVHLELHGIDKYDRVLATVYVSNNSELINVNEEMVKKGHAWVMRLFYDKLSKSRQARLNRLESWAKSHQVGLWKTKNPIPPWEWRKKNAA